MNRFVEVTKLEYLNKNNKVLGYIKKGYNDNEFDIYIMYVDGPLYYYTYNNLEYAKEKLVSVCNELNIK